MNENDENSLYGKATKEEDEPISPFDLWMKFTDNKKEVKEEDLETQRLKIEEKKEERNEKRYFNAVKIFIGCLVFLGAVYGLDVIVNGFIKGEVSSMTDGVVEIIKTLLFTLSGYLFARNDNK